MRTFQEIHFIKSVFIVYTLFYQSCASNKKIHGNILTDNCIIVNNVHLKKCSKIKLL